MVNPVGVADQRIGQTAQIDESVPVGIVAGQSRDLKTQNKPHVSERDLGGQAGETGSRYGSGSRQTKILVDDHDIVGDPSKIGGLVHQSILPVGRLAVVFNLSGAGLAQVDDGHTSQMA